MSFMRVRDAEKRCTPLLTSHVHTTKKNDVDDLLAGIHWTILGLPRQKMTIMGELWRHQAFRMTTSHCDCIL